MDTPIFRHAANYTGWQAKPVPPVADPRRVVWAILRSVEYPRRKRTVGNWGRLLEVGHGVAPGVFGRLVPTVMNTVALGRQRVPVSDGNVFEPMPEWNKSEGTWRNRPLRMALGAVATAAATGGVIGARRWRTWHDGR